MDLVIINKSSQMPIQSYVGLSDESNNRDPQMDQLSRENIIVTGETAADVRLGIDGKYIYLGVWKGNGNSVDSWVVIEREDGAITDSQFSNFNIDVDKNEYQFTAMITDRDSSTDTNKTITGIVVGSIIVGVILFLAFVMWLVFK